MPTPIDLSKARKLEKVKFRLDVNTPNIEWITTTLHTTKSPKLQHIAIHFYIRWVPTEERIREEWRDLDCLLARLWTSHSIRPEIKFLHWNLGNVGPILLPGLATMGAFDSVVS